MKETSGYNKPETDTGIEEKLVVTSERGWGRGKMREGDWEIQTPRYKISKMQSIIMHIFYNNFIWKIIYKNIK